MSHQPTTPWVQIQGAARTLVSAAPGQSFNIESLMGNPIESAKLMERGLTPGQSITLIRRAPLGDPLEIKVRNYHLLLRADQARQIRINTDEPAPFNGILSDYYNITSQTQALTQNTLRIGLIGHPNSGKSTLFNALSGQRAHIANYPGVTIDQYSAHVTLESGHSYELIDFPGCNSLMPFSEEEALTTRELLSSNQPHNKALDLILCVIDATSIERGLYLTFQLLELGRPICLILNMMDEAAQQKIEIDLQKLKNALKIPIFAISAQKNQGVKEINDYINKILTAKNITFHQYELVSEKKSDYTSKNINKSYIQVIKKRYEAIDSLKNLIHYSNLNKKSLTQKIDSILTHPIYGIFCFLSVISIIFSLLFSISEPFTKIIQSFIEKIANQIQNLLPESWATSLFTEGILNGIGTTTSFLPQILILLFLINFLESLGYLPRAAFLIDRIMRYFGLNGKAFVPMLSGFVCAVPAIASVRTLENRRDRILTMMAIPLMSCSARLPVYSLIISVMLPENKSTQSFIKPLILLTIYIISTFFSFLALFILSKTIFKTTQTPLLLELPPYRLPNFKILLNESYLRAKSFIKTVGTVIIAAICILWFLFNYPKPEQNQNTLLKQSLSESDYSSYIMKNSYAGKIGHFIEPAIQPLGFDWKIGIGLLGSFAAREVFIATMAVTYHSQSQHNEESTLLQEKMRQERGPSNQLVYSIPTCLSLLTFFMLVCQCSSTLAAISRETRSFKWPLFAFSYMFVLAYAASFLVYRISISIMRH